MRLKPMDVLKVLISLALIVYLMWRVDLAAVSEAMRGASVPLWFLALLVYFGAIVLNTAKWGVLLRAQGASVSYSDLLAYTFTGLFFGNFLPTNVGGDLVRGYDLARHVRRVEDAAISVLVDRLVGLTAFITSAGAMSVVAVFVWGRQDLRGLATIVWLATAAALVGLAVLFSKRLRSLVGRLFRIGPLAKLEPVYLHLSVALQAYRDHPGALARAYVLGLLVIVVSNVVNWLVATSVHVDIPMSYIFLFNPMLAFAPLIVPSLGGLGVNQGAYDLLYSNLGGVATPAGALTVSLLMQLVIYASSLPGGVLWLRRRRAQTGESSHRDTETQRD